MPGMFKPAIRALPGRLEAAMRLWRWITRPDPVDALYSELRERRNRLALLQQIARHPPGEQEMEEQLISAGSTCKLCGTEPNQFVYAQYKQSCWCPRCGMPPIPVPSFMSGDNQ